MSDSPTYTAYDFVPMECKAHEWNPRPHTFLPGKYDGKLAYFCSRCGAPFAKETIR